MKKVFIATGLALTMALSSFANTPGPTDVEGKILDNFAGKFLSAEKVQWIQSAAYTQASFVWQHQEMEVFYDKAGDLYAISRKIKYESLPLNTILAIQEKYGNYVIGESIEMNSTEDGLSYYISVSNSNRKIILKSTPQGQLTIFKKEKI